MLNEMGLLSYYEGCRQKHAAEAIMEALQFYKRNQRWPKNYECSSSLRRRRYQCRQSWETFVQQTNFHPRIIDHLVEAWKSHFHWATQVQSPHARLSLVMINMLIEHRPQSVLSYHPSL